MYVEERNGSAFERHGVYLSSGEDGHVLARSFLGDSSCLHARDSQPTLRQTTLRANFEINCIVYVYVVTVKRKVTGPCVTFIRRGTCSFN